MTQIHHIQCDACGKKAVMDDSKLHRERGWASCRVELNTFDFCPTCWKKMTTLANVKPVNQ
jgi:hypothetical protein